MFINKQNCRLRQLTFVANSTQLKSSSDAQLYHQKDLFVPRLTFPVPRKHFLRRLFSVLNNVVDGRS